MATRWSEREIEYLHDNMGILSYSELSKELKRSENAIRLYRCRNGLPTFFENIYTYALLANELGKSRASLRKYVKKGWLLGKVGTWTCKWGKHPMIFLEKNIVRFLKNHYSLFRPSSIPNLYFRNVVGNIYKEVKS